MAQKIVVTGAFGYSGSYIAELLLERGYEVMTLTQSPNRQNFFDGAISVCPYNFDQPEALVNSLRGTDVLINTYWVRFNHRDFTHEQAVKNSFKLFDAAVEAGVKKVIHVSITNPSLDSDLEYFSGKAEIEGKLKDTGISYTILRPAVLFGGQDILINNIAWSLRKLPIMGIFGDGTYKLQPIHVKDLAILAVSQMNVEHSAVIDAIGPETYTYRELVRTIGNIIGKNRPLISISPWFGYWGCKLLGKLVGDIIITREEIKGLMRGLLCTESAPSGSTKLSEWAEAHADTLGQHYANELHRREDRKSSYSELDSEL